MRVLAVVTARGGSKRLPGKNLLPLGGRPLIAWSIDVAKDIPQVCDILVTTDDPAIAQVSQQAGALVPWLRPPELATDTAGSVEVCLHALDWYERERGTVDGLLLLQPTSPFRSRATVMRGIDLFFQNNRRAVVGVAPAASHPLLCYRIDNGTMRPFVEREGGHLRSQDMPPAYVVNGGCYLIAPEELRETHSFYTTNTVPLIVADPLESLDIDTPLDWSIATDAAPRLSDRS